MRATRKADEPRPCLPDLRQEQKRAVGAARAQWQEEKQPESYAPPTTADWKECAKEIRKALCRDQRHLCAYCMQRIKIYPGDNAVVGAVPSSPPETLMKIEHFVARTANWEKIYAWYNLLGVCCGKTFGETHCDGKRGNTPLNHHPIDDAAVLKTRFHYSRKPPPGVTTVGFWVSGEDAQAQEDIKTLNLNAAGLARNRNDALDHIKGKMRALSDRGKAKAFAEKRLAAARGTKPPPFAQLVEEYLEKKLSGWSQ